MLYCITLVEDEIQKKKFLQFITIYKLNLYQYHTSIPIFKSNKTYISRNSNSGTPKYETHFKNKKGMLKFKEKKIYKAQQQRKAKTHIMAMEICLRSVSMFFMLASDCALKIIASHEHILYCKKKKQIIILQSSPKHTI